MSVSKIQINTLGEVNAYSVLMQAGLGSPTTEYYPAQDALQDDQFYRLLLTFDIQWAKSGGPQTVYSVAFGGGPTGSTSYQTVWQRYMSSTDGTGTDAALQGEETRAQASYYRPGEVIRPPLLLPPGMGIRLVGGPSAFNLAEVRAIIAEDKDPSKLWPFVGRGVAGPQ